MCRGGMKQGPYMTLACAKYGKPEIGLWQLRKKRVSAPIEYKGYNIEHTLHGLWQVYINDRLMRVDTLEEIKQIIDKYEKNI